MCVCVFAYVCAYLGGQPKRMLPIAAETAPTIALTRILLWQGEGASCSPRCRRSLAGLEATKKRPFASYLMGRCDIPYPNPLGRLVWGG